MEGREETVVQVGPRVSQAIRMTGPYGSRRGLRPLLTLRRAVGPSRRVRPVSPRRLPASPGRSRCAKRG